MTSLHTPILIAALWLLTASHSPGQSADTSATKNRESQSAENNPAQNIVVITGARFAYPLVEHWIEAYSKVKQHVQILVEPRGSTDPLKYDILVEAYEHDDQLKRDREYLYIGRYAVLPVATSTSSFAITYTEKGLNNDLIKHIFFDDIFSDRSKQKAIAAPYTVYTRLQKAGVPSLFSEYFGFEQKDLKGISIAGADMHLLKAIFRDSAGVTYLPLPLIYDAETRKPVEGVAVLPVDLNGNKKVSDEEKFYDTIDRVVETLEALDPHKINNIPIGYLHLSVDKNQAKKDAIDFLKWVNEHAPEHLHAFGYMKPDAKHFKKDTSSKLASEHGKQ